MNAGKTVFAQVMEYLPLPAFRKCVQRYRGNYKGKTFSSLGQFLVMAFAHLSITLFEKMPMSHVLTNFDYETEHDESPNQLLLFNSCWDSSDIYSIVDFKGRPVPFTRAGKGRRRRGRNRCQRYFRKYQAEGRSVRDRGGKWQLQSALRPRRQYWLGSR